MIRTMKFFSVIAFLVIVVSCGHKDELSAKKANLEKLKSEQLDISDKIRALEKEIALIDTTASKDNDAKLVELITIKTQDFVHYIDLQGKVDADNISNITPRLGGGQVKVLLVKKGDFVKKGQLLLKLDDAVVKQQVNAAKQNLETIKTQLSYAKDIYNRQNNLWSQGIGTEVQLLSAKNNVETIEKQLKAADENVKTIQEQLSASNVYSDVDGIADEVNIKVGELFTGQQGQIKIVNTKTLKVVTDIPENYSTRVRVGSKLIVVVPDLNNKTYNTTVSLSSRVIDLNNRSFIAEGKLPYDGVLRPNQIAQVRIQDYAASNAVVIPVNTVQTDDKGKYVYAVTKKGNTLVAAKKQIVIGELYGELVEVKSGLAAGDQLVTEGYQNLYDGQLLKTK